MEDPELQGDSKRARLEPAAVEELKQEVDREAKQEDDWEVKAGGAALPGQAGCNPAPKTQSSGPTGVRTKAPTFPRAALCFHSVPYLSPDSDVSPCYDDVPSCPPMQASLGKQAQELTILELGLLGPTHTGAEAAKVKLRNSEEFETQLRRDLDLPPEEVAANAAIRKARAQEVQLAAGRNFDARERAKGETAYKGYVTARRKEYDSRNRDKVLKTHKVGRDRVVAEKRHHCADCDESFQINAALDKHRKTRRHLDKVAGVSQAPRSATEERWKAAADKKKADAKASGLYRCSPCDKSFPNKSQLDRHLAGLHERQVARLASSE
ncbi:hypothetical protein B0I35DRAFT_411896 [Stachybotrys elegans]|uniref:C2H2-type domain-containing protein n=1 Tax=Stachybotrys elegans TaxID=80388 RepID=A0A8K0SGX0_9HYPO|nr:hypothetical protein B0I35DRAFT_411896 [Stachybotrys elegans]